MQRMPEIFVDTSGWGCLVDRSQNLHTPAVEIYETARTNNQRLFTTNYIIAELVALLTSPLRIPRQKIIEFIQSLRASPFVEILHVDPETDAEAWKLLADRPDKEWSLVDCSSFVVMQSLGITEALTTDRNFEQAGLVRLLK